MRTQKRTRAQNAEVETGSVPHVVATTHIAVGQDPGLAVTLVNARTVIDAAEGEGVGPLRVGTTRFDLVFVLRARLIGLK